MELVEILTVAALLMSYSSVQSLKVLIYSPALGHSHLQFVGKIADILVVDGHYVHVLIPEWDPKLTTNGTRYAQRVTRLNPSKPSQYSSMQFLNDPFGDPPNNFYEADKFISIINQFCEDFLSNKELIEELRADHYDIALTEMYDYCPCGLFEVLGIRSWAFLAATSINNLLADTWAIPSPSSYVPEIFNSYINAPQLTFFQRVSSLFRCAVTNIRFRGRILNVQNAIFKRMVRKDFPDLKYLAQRASFAFVNSLPIIDIQRPITSKIIFVGGIANKNTTKLSKQFANLYEGTRKGVVLFSLGSLVKTDKIPDYIKSGFLRAFARFPDYDFIVKMAINETDRANYNYENIHFFDWIEQVGLLNHPKTKAFITHAGLNSIIEATFSGTPLICIPLFADQQYNTAIILNKHIGVYLEKKLINTEIVTRALEKVLYDPSYAKAAKLVQEQIYYYPHNSTQLFLNWIRYAAQFQETIDLNLYGINLNMITYFSLDVIAFLFFMFSCFTAVISFIVIYTFKKIRQFFQKLKKE